MGLTWAWVAGALIGWFFVAPIIKGPIDSVVSTVFRSGAATYAPGTTNVLSPTSKYFRHPWLRQ